MNEQQPKHSDESKKVAATEAEYLQNQVNEASAAISGAFAALKADLMKGADPRAWANQYPWVAVGAAAVAGFAAASALVPSKEEQALKKLERIERALRPEPMAAPAAHPGQPGAKPAHESKSLTGRLFSEVFSALKPALSSALAAYAAGNAANGDNADHPSNGNGHSSAAAAGNAAYYQQESDPDQA